MDRLPLPSEGRAANHPPGKLSAGGERVKPAASAGISLRKIDFAQRVHSKSNRNTSKKEKL